MILYKELSELLCDGVLFRLPAVGRINLRIYGYLKNVCFCITVIRTKSGGEIIVALSVRIDAELEARIDQEARRLGVSKSEFVKDALERTLGYKNPAELLARVRTGAGAEDPDLSIGVSTRVKDKLNEKHSR